jgi:hypothetical protein
MEDVFVALEHVLEATAKVILAILERERGADGLVYTEMKGTMCHPRRHLGWI